jgi:hemolysin III
MADSEQVRTYPPLEEKINIASHAFGLVLSVCALVLLLNRAIHYGNAWHIVSAAIFGLSMVSLYAASTIYHSARRPDFRLRMRIVDHASIYLLISGTYTPFTLITLQGPTGWTIFSISWAMAVTGIVLKLFYTGRFTLLSTLMYVFMGWLIVFAVEPLMQALPHAGLVWLVAGGLSYTAGATLYAIPKIPYNHSIFHIFVLAGSFCHFVAIYGFVLPGT